MAKDKESKPAEAKFEGGGGMNTGVALVGFILCFLAGAGLMWGYDTNRMKQGGGGAITADTTAAWSDEESPVPVSSKDPVWGNRAAPVTIVVFSDFQCPFCSRVEPALTQVVQEYGNRVRIVWRDYPLPFHPNAMPAAQAAREVLAQGGPAKFWAYHDLLFQNQQNLDRPTLERLAQQVGGINMTNFRQALDTNRHQAAVQADMNAIQAAGISQFGTPTSFINGRMLSGAQPYDAFKTAIDAALAAH